MVNLKPLKQVTNRTRKKMKKRKLKKKVKRKESRVAKKMKELTSRKLVILMLLMLIFVPLMDFTNFGSEEMNNLDYMIEIMSSLFKQYKNTSPKNRYRSSLKSHSNELIFSEFKINGKSLIFLSLPINRPYPSEDLIFCKHIPL